MSENFTSNTSPVPMGCTISANGNIQNSAGRSLTPDEVTSLPETVKRLLLSTGKLNERYAEILKPAPVKKEAKAKTEPATEEK